MPKLYETCVMSGVGFTATSPARLIDFRLEPAGSNAYIGGTNGVGKTSNVIQPLFWLLKPREKVAGREMRSIIDDVRTDNPTPYVFYSIWRLDEPAGTKLDFDSMLLVAGYVISPYPSPTTGDMQGDFFYFKCGIDEVRTDRAGLLARHGIDVYIHDGKDNTYRFRSFEDIHDRIRAACKDQVTVCFPLRRHSEFRRDLEHKMLFFDIDKYAILQRLAVFQENAIGNLDKIYKTSDSFLTDLLLPIVTSKSFDRKTRDRLVSEFMGCAEARNNHKARFDSLNYYRRMAAYGNAALADARDIEGLAVSLKRSLETGTAVLASRDAVLSSLEEEAAALDMRRDALEVDRARIELERDSSEVRDAEEAYRGGLEEAERAQEADVAAESAFMKAEEIVLRHKAISAYGEMEAARGEVYALNARLTELDSSEDGRLRENLSATLNLKLSRAADEKAGLEAAARAAAAEDEKEAAAIGERVRALDESVNDMNYRLGDVSGKAGAALSAYTGALRGAGCDDLAKKKGETPDMNGMDSRRVSFGREAERAGRAIAAAEARIDEAAAKRETEAATIRKNEDARRGLEAKRDSIGRARGIVSDAVEEAGRLDLEVPDSDEGAQDAIDEIDAAIESKRAAVSDIANDIKSVRAERDGLSNGAAHVAEKMTAWLSRLGVAYQTGQSKLEKMARNGADVQAILAAYPYFASAVIVGADQVDLVLEKAAEEADVWCAGAAVLLTETQAEELGADGADASRILALPHKRYLADGKAYLDKLDARISELDERSMQLKSDIILYTAKQDALKSLVMAFRTARAMVGASGLEELDAALDDIDAALAALDEDTAAKRSAIGALDAAIAESRASIHLMTEERDLLVSKSKAVQDAQGFAREYMGYQPEIRELNEKIEAGKADRERLAAERDDLKKSACARLNEAENRKLEREGLISEAATYISFIDSRHTVVEGSIDNLKSRLDVLDRRFDADKSAIRAELDRAQGDFKKKAVAYNEQMDRYAKSYSAISRETIDVATDETPVACSDAARDLDSLKRSMDSLHVVAEAARKAAAEKEKALDRCRALFRANHPDAAVLEKEDIGGRDFAARIKSMDDAIRGLVSELDKIGTAKALVLQAASRLHQVKSDCILRYREDSELESDLEAFLVEVGDADDFIEKAGVAARKIQEDDEAYRDFSSYGFERSIDGIKREIEKREERPYVYSHLVRMGKSFMGCIGLAAALEKNTESWEFEALAIEKELERLDDDVFVLVTDLVDVIDKMVESARQVESRSGNVIRLSGMGTGHPDGDSLFESEMSAWVDQRIDLLARKLARGEEIREKAKVDCANAKVLLNRWANYKGGRDTEPQLRIRNGKILKKEWEGWEKFNSAHSGGEKSTTMHQLGAALLSLCKPRDPDTGKTLEDVSIPFIQDAPFKSVSDIALIDNIFDIYERNGVQLISVADDSPETVRVKFPIRYRLVTGKTRGGFTIDAREEEGMASIIRASYNDDYKGPIQQSLFDFI